MVLKEYLKQTKRDRDILIYEYENDCDYLLIKINEFNFTGLYDLNKNKFIEVEEADHILSTTEVLCEYEMGEVKALQVRFN